MAAPRQLTQAKLEELQADAMADDVDVDLAKMSLWTEEQVTAYFESGGTEEPGAQWTPPPPAPKLPPAPPEEFKKWFPKAGTRDAPPKFRMVCFHCAGGAESIYTSRGMRQPTENPMVLWCRDQGGELLACELPGREQRRKEELFTSLAPAAAALFPVLAPVLQEPVPYALVGHSVGSWMMFELIKLLMARGIPLPKVIFVSCFPAPSCPPLQRPWRPSRKMDDEGFKTEARTWDVNEVVFQPHNWKTFEKMMRTDFLLFDEYKCAARPAARPRPAAPGESARAPRLASLGSEPPRRASALASCAGTNPRRRPSQCPSCATTRRLTRT
jgi:surfactin synthase thioesterase subunit